MSEALLAVQLQKGSGCASESGRKCMPNTFDLLFLLDRMVGVFLGVCLLVVFLLGSSG